MSLFGFVIGYALAWLGFGAYLATTLNSSPELESTVAPSAAEPGKVL